MAELSNFLTMLCAIVILYESFVVLSGKSSTVYEDAEILTCVIVQRRVLLEYSNHTSPFHRAPLCDQVDLLAESDPELLELPLAYLDSRSW